MTVRVEAVNLTTGDTKAALPTRACQALQVAVMLVCTDGGMMFVRIKRRRRAVAEKLASVRLCVPFESGDVCRF